MTVTSYHCRPIHEIKVTPDILAASLAQLVVLELLAPDEAERLRLAAHDARKKRRSNRSAQA